MTPAPLRLVTWLWLGILLTSAILGGGWLPDGRALLQTGLLGLLLFSWLLRGPVSGPLLPWALLWLAWIFAASAGSPHPSTALQSAWIKAAGIAAFLLAQAVRAEALALRWPLLLAGVGFPILAFGYWAGGDPASFFPNRNLMAGFLLLALPPCGTAFFRSPRRGERRAGLGLGLLGLVLFLATGSRAAWIALALASLPSAISLVKRYRRRAAGLLAGALAFLLFLGPGDWAGSFSDRLRWWSAAFRMFLENPLSGAGPGHFGLLYPRFAEPGTLHTLFAHSVPLEILAETGLIGLALSAAFLLYGLRWARSGPSDPLSTGMKLGLAALLIQNLVDHSLFAPVNWALVGWNLGLVCPASEPPPGPEASRPSRGLPGSRSGRLAPVGAALVVFGLLTAADFSLRPCRSHRRVAEGLDRLNRGDTEGAAERLREARRLDPGSLESLQLSVAVRRRLFRSTGSASHLEEAASELNAWKAIPATARLWKGLALDWTLAGQAGRAGECLEQAARVNPLLETNGRRGEKFR